MDNNQNDTNSESDSAESWTFLDSNPYNLNTAPLPDEPVAVTNSAELYNGNGLEKDEETDGISIISDCDSESTYDHNDVENAPSAKNDETPNDIVEHVLVAPDPFSPTESDESAFEDILSDKIESKTCVHKRNNKVSSLITLLLMGSILTLAGIAVGHLWGVKQTNQLVNKLNKLQLENAFLRNKLKELTFASNIQVKQNKVVENPSKCEKIFEEPLQKVSTGPITKCVDPDTQVESTLGQYAKGEFVPKGPQNEFPHCNGNEYRDCLPMLKNLRIKKELNNINSKRFIDEMHVVKFRKFGKETVSNNKPKDKSSQPEEKKKEVYSASSIFIKPEKIETPKLSPSIPKVTYADLLKRSHFNKLLSDERINNIKHEDSKVINNLPYKRKSKQIHENVKSENLRRQVQIESEDEDLILKEKYQNPKKYKAAKPKNDREQKKRKDKRKNKYQQWEMKGGYLQDYESVASLNIEEQIPQQINRNIGINYNYIDESPNKDKNESKFSKTESSEKKSNLEKHNFIIINKDNGKNKVNESSNVVDGDWFIKRSSMRLKAREELSKTNYRMKMNALWYFRRMKERQNQRFNDVHNTYIKKRHHNYKQKR